MNLADLLPPSDVLERTKGLETTLRRNRRVGLFGFLGLLLSALIQFAYATGLLKANELLKQPLFLVSIALLLIFVLTATWWRFWVKESRRPFRYTYSIDSFQRLTDEADSQLEWLPQDLSKKLSERIGRRLSLLNQPDAQQIKDEGVASTYDSHIRITGYYGKRLVTESEWIIEVVPEIQIAASGATLGRAVRYPLGRAASQENAAASSAEPSRTTPITQPPVLGAAEYSALFERVYFSVASHIYSQIRDDVQRKIGLLPTRFLRATAYLREAEDYAGSNTLAAYSDASLLFQEAGFRYDPSRRRLPRSPLRRLPARVVRGCSTRLRRLLTKGSWLWPRLGRREIFAASAELGYARTLLARWYLADLSGARTRPPFVAARMSERALQRLDRLPDDVSGKLDTLFRGYVTLAWAECQFGDVEAAADWLERARSLRPSRAEEDSLYLFVAGQTEPAIIPSLRLLRRAVEIRPTFEIAHASLALQLEKLWRTRATFEPSVAMMLCEEYAAVVNLNPGNIAMWSKLGYAKWLLAGSSKGQLNADLAQEATRAYEVGRDYKNVRGDTIVGELDYGLARLAAEEPNLDKAYEHYLGTVSAQLGQHKLSETYADYFFDFCGKALLERFRLYLQRVEEQIDGENVAPGDERERLTRSVHAFALNDYGQAAFHYFLRSGHAHVLSAALDAYTRASKENPEFVLPLLNLATLHKTLADRADADPTERRQHLLEAEHALNDALSLEPDWATAQLDLVEIHCKLLLLIQPELKEITEELEKSKAAIDSSRAKLHQLEVRETTGVTAPVASPAAFEEGLELSVGPVSLKLGARSSPADGESLDLASPLPDLERATQLDGRAQGAGLRTLRNTLSRYETEAANLKSKADQLSKDRDSRLERAATLVAALLPHQCFATVKQSALSDEADAGSDDSDLRSASRHPRGRAHVAVRRMLAADLRASHRVVIQSLIDFEGTNVDRFLEADVEWEDEFDELHVDALIAWAEVLEAAATEGSLRAAAKVCEHIQRHYHAAELSVLVTRRDACTVLQDRLDAGAEERDRHSAVIEECRRKIGSLVVSFLGTDPAHFNALTWVVELDETERGRVLKRALHSRGATAPVLVWLGDQLGMQQVTGADPADAYRKAIDVDSSVAASQAAMKLGDLLLEREDQPGAEKAYSKAVELQEPDTAPQAALRLGGMLRGRGDVTGAANVYERVVAAGPRAALQLGDLLQDQAEPREAEKAYRHAIESEEPSVVATAHLRLGDLLLGREDRAEAKQAYRRAIESGDSTVLPTAQLKLGDLLTGEDDVGAEEAYREAIESGDSATVAPAGVRLGDLLRERGAGEDAEWAYRQAIESGELSILSHAAARLGDLLKGSGDHSGATEAYGRVIASGSQAALLLGDHLRGRGDLDDAEELYHLGAEQPDDAYAPDAALRLGELSAERGEVAAAEAAFRKAIASDDDTVVPSALLKLGDLLAGPGREGGADEAQKAYRRAIDAGDPARAAEAGLKLGELLRQGGGFEPANQAYERVIASGSQAACTLGDLLRERGNGEAAERVYRGGAERPDDAWAPDAALRLGELLTERGDAGGAAKALRKAIASDDDTVVPTAMLKLGDLLAGSRQVGEAVGVYRQAIDSGDATVAAEAGLKLAALQVARGEPAKATKTYAVVSATGAQAAVTLGDLLRDRREMSEAERAYRTGARLSGDPFAPDAALRLGELLAKRGDLHQAKEALHQAIASGKGSVVPKAQLTLGDLIADDADGRDAEEAYRQAIESRDYYVVPNAALRLGDLIRARGDDSQADDAYGRVITSGSQAAIWLGDVFTARGDLDRAASIYRLGAELRADPYAPDAALRLGELLAQRKDAERAEAAYRVAIASEDVTVVPTALLKLGDLLAAVGTKDEAEQAYREAIASYDPDVRPTAQLRLADLLTGLGREREAEEGYWQAFDSLDATVVARAGLKLADLQHHDPASEEISEIYERVLASGALAALTLGDLLRERGNREVAELMYRRVAERPNDPHAAGAAVRLGELLTERGDTERAERAYRQAIASDDAVVPTALMKLGDLLAGLGEEGEAREAEDAYRQAIDSGNPIVAAEAALKLADLFQRSDRSEQASLVYERVVASGSRAACALGDLLQERGNNEAAEHAYRNGAERWGDPYAPDAALRLGGLLAARGDTVGAEKNYRRASASGDHTVVPDARKRLNELLQVATA